MKTTQNLLLAGMLAAFGCSLAHAQFSYSNSLVGATAIYSHTFNGGAVDLNGLAPSYINPNAAAFGGSTTAAFDVVTNSTANGYYAYQDGTLCANRESVLLPFTPQSGYIYTLSATLTFPVTPPAGGWGAFGYGGAFPASNSSANDPRIGQPLVGGNPWALLNMYANGGGSVFYDTRTHSFPGVANLLNALNTPFTINMVVDTTSTHWYTALFVAGTLVKDTNYTATANPTIRSIGYGQTTTTAGAFKWNSLALYASRLLLVQPPAAGLVSPGHAFTNTVVLASATTPSCQWYFNSTSNYAGASVLTNSLDGRVLSYGTLTNSLVITNLQAADQGYYFVIATNTYGAVTSSIVSLVVPLNVEFTSQLPATYTNKFTLFAGSSPRFSVATVGTPPIRYQWYANGVAASGQTNATFTWTNVPAGTITAYCVATNNASTATSTMWTASVLGTPTAPFPAYLLSLHPSGFWQLTEGPDDYAGDNGVVALDYAAGNNGIYSNAVLGVSGYSPDTDPSVTAAYFSSFASTDSDVFNIQGVDFGAPSGSNAVFSVSAWVTGTGSQTSGAGILAKGYGNAEQFVLDVFGGKYRFAVRDAGGNFYSATATLGPTGNWDYLVGVCDEAHSTLTLYVNGVPAASAAIAPGSGLLASSVPMTIGARSSTATIGHNDLQFKGFINDVSVFNYALSVAQEATLYTAAGYTIPVSYVPPPAAFAYQPNKPMTIPASAFGAANLGYYWTDTSTSALLGAGSINTFTTLDASLTIPNASPSLSGHQLQLVITNGTSSQSWYVALYCPPPPAPLDYASPILYSNYFNGGTWSIAGTPPTAANALVGGTNTTWVDALGTNDTGSLQANGVSASTLGDSWLLPFTPHAGYVYTVSASLTFTNNPGSWVGLGFAQRVPTNAASGYGRFSDGGATPPQQGPNGYDWIILTESTGNIQYFTGPGGSPAGGITNYTPYFPAGAGTHTVTVVLDTTGTQWKYSASVDGISTVTYTYSSNPPIGAVGITQTTQSNPGALQWNYFALTQVAPDGVPPYLFAPLPPTNVTLLAGTSLSIPASAFGSVPVGYYWSNTNTAAVLASGTTNNLAPLLANLSVSAVPFSWNGNTLALTVTNAYGTNISLVALTVTNNPAPGPIHWTFTNGLLTLSWTDKGATLLAQSNSPGVGLGTNWVVVPGSTALTNLVVPVSPANGSVFFRLRF